METENEKIIRLLEEIRDQQKMNIQTALDMQKRATIRLTIAICIMIVLIWFIVRLSS